MHPTQQALEFIREFLKLGSPSCASLRRKKNLPLICLFVKPLIYCFLAGFLFHPFFARLGYILQSGAGSFSMHYLSQLDWGWHHLTSSLDYLRILKGQQIK
jgi:hypothetical protein